MTSRPILALRSLISWVLALLVLCSLAALLIPLSLFFPPTRLHWLMRGGCRALLAVCGIRVRLLGAEHLNRATCIYMSNHVNMMDHIGLMTIVAQPMAGLEAAEHFSLPVYGWILRRWGMMPVSRSGDKQMNERSLAEALATLKQGRSLGIMPEGHRTRDGRLGAFRMGGFNLAVQAQVPIAPIVQRGAEAIMRKGDFLIRPGVVTLDVQPQVPPGDDPEALMQRVRAIFLRELGQAPDELDVVVG